MTLKAPTGVTFLPYLSGERTPHNDAVIRGAFIGLGHESDRAVLTQAVLEGVTFAIRDNLEALKSAGTSHLPRHGHRRRFALALLAGVDRDLAWCAGRYSGRWRFRCGLRCRPAGSDCGDGRRPGCGLHGAEDGANDRAGHGA